VPEVVVAFLGDVVGNVGRRAVAHAIPVLRETKNVSVFIVNGENSRQGAGITADNVRELIRSGVHAITLGDHVYKDRAVIPVLADPLEPIARPANLALAAPGKRIIRLDLVAPAGKTTSDGTPLYIITVLGRIFMPIPSDNPFSVVDREIAAIPEKNALVIVEVHAETTSEKQAMAWHCLQRWTSNQSPRVVAVVGTHTHVQTADARIIDHCLAAITDLGMCGPHRGVIGRSAEATVKAMSEQCPVPLDVASDDLRACGVVIRLDPISRRAVAIEAVSIPCRP
jgi:2',3'-cyclic-nucleotide 2'-phosphodiesterase